MLYLRFSSNEIPRCVIARESNILMSISLASPAHKIVIHNFSLIREFTHVLTKNKKIYFYVAREACKWANTSPNKLWLLLLFHASLIRFRLFQWIARWRPIHPHYNLLFFNSNDESFIESRWGQPLNDEGRKSDFSTFFIKHNDKNNGIINPSVWPYHRHITHNWSGFMLEQIDRKPRIRMKFIGSSRT